MHQQVTRKAKDVIAYAKIAWAHKAFIRVDDDTTVTLMFSPDVSVSLLTALDKEDDSVDT